MPIVKNGLISYWNYKQGYSNSKWSNIAPTNLGKYDLILTGPSLRENGVYLDGVDDGGISSTPFVTPTQMTIEGIFTTLSWGDSLKSASLIFGVTEMDDLIPFIVWLDYTSMNPNIAPGFIFLAQNSEGLPMSVAYDLTLNKKIYVQITLNNVTKVAKVWIGGILVGTVPSEIIHGETVTLQMGSTGIVPSGGAIISMMRLYNRILTDAELLQNYQNGDAVGLADTPPPSNPPSITSIIPSKQKISDEIDNNQSVITVRFDKNVVEYVARLNGTSYNTGTLVHQGGAVTANTNTQVIIDWNELVTEGQNRINIYGKDADGLWTPYTN